MYLINILFSLCKNQSFSLMPNQNQTTGISSMSKYKFTLSFYLFHKIYIKKYYNTDRWWTWNTLPSISISMEFQRRHKFTENRRRKSTIPGSLYLQFTQESYQMKPIDLLWRRLGFRCLRQCSPAPDALQFFKVESVQDDIKI